MHILAICFYIFLLFLVGFYSYKKHQTSTDFILGSRKMNFWLTALAAHVSDMSSWIFMAYPAVIYSTGLINAWLAIGLTLFMFLNWQFVAPRLRSMTESYGSLTLPSFFESRFRDTSGMIRIATIVISYVYYTIYISAALVSLGILLHTLFGLPYLYGVIIGALIIAPYLFAGGYITLAWTDLFQGFFLVTVIVLVPLYALPQIGGFAGLMAGLDKGTSLFSFWPGQGKTTWISVIFALCSWGLGYFGQPHIITKFMGIKNGYEIPKSKWLGTSWQIISLSAATLVGLVGIVFFANNPLQDTQLVFVNMVLALFSPFLAAFILCAILGATLTSMGSQILILASTLTEDLYKKVIRKTASSKELLLVSRISVFFATLTSFVIAVATNSTIFGLVSYAWFGLGASFGPLVLFSLYSKKVTRTGALCGVISGALVSGSWIFINQFLPWEIPTLIPGCLISSFTIWFVSSMSENKSDQGRVQV